MKTIYWYFSVSAKKKNMSIESVFILFKLKVAYSDMGWLNYFLTFFKNFFPHLMA